MLKCRVRLFDGHKRHCLQSPEYVHISCMGVFYYRSWTLTACRLAAEHCMKFG